jgi:hypothetical protein
MCVHKQNPSAIPWHSPISSHPLVLLPLTTLLNNVLIPSCCHYCPWEICYTGCKAHCLSAAGLTNTYLFDAGHINERQWYFNTCTQCTMIKSKKLAYLKENYNFFEVLGLKLRAFTLSHSPTPTLTFFFFCDRYFWDPFSQIIYPG